MSMSSPQLKLIKGAQSGNLERVKNLLLTRKEISVDEEDELGLTPLIWAAHEGHQEIVKILLDHHAKIDKKAKNGATALHQAAFMGHSAVVEILLRRGANPFMETDQTTNPPNVTPLEWAICSTQANPQTRGLLREAMERFDEQEKRVFRKFLQQNGLEQYEKIFTGSERERILKIVHKKKHRPFNNAWFSVGIHTPPTPLVHTGLKRKKSVNFAVDHFDSTVASNVQRGVQKLEAISTGAAVTPAVGLFRIQEHVFYSLPNVVQSKASLNKTTAEASGGVSDLIYARDEVLRLAPMNTFMNIKALVLHASDVALKIRQVATDLSNGGTGQRKLTTTSTISSNSQAPSHSQNEGSDHPTPHAIN